MAVGKSGKGVVMRFVFCTGIDSATGVEVEAVLNLSRVVTMIRDKTLTAIRLANGHVCRVKESPSELFRKEDAMALCINTTGLEFQQILKEGRRRISDQLAEEERSERERLEKDRKDWDQRERRKLERAVDKSLAELLIVFARDNFDGNLGSALFKLVTMGASSRQEEHQRATDLAADLAKAVAEDFDYTSPEAVISNRLTERKAEKAKDNRKKANRKKVSKKG